MASYMQLNSQIPGTLGPPSPKSATIQGPSSTWQPGLAGNGSPLGIMGQLAQPQPQQPQQSQPAQAPRPVAQSAARGLSIPTQTSQDQINAQRAAASQAAAKAANAELEAKYRADEDRNRAIQQERDMTHANQQMAANMGGAVSGEWGYVYPSGDGSDGGGGSRSSGGGGGSAPAAPAQRDPQLDALIAGLTQQQAPVPPPAYVGPPQVPQAEGMFAHAKDVSGRVGNKALDAFRNLMTKRGMSGSGMEAEGEANILGDVATQQSNAEYDQANLNNSRQWDANKLGYSGDMSQNALGYQGAITQRGQNQSALLQLLNMSNRY